MSRILRNLLGTAGVLAICELVGRSGLVNPDQLPPPSVIGARLVELFNDYDFSLDVVATVFSWAMALGIAILIAVPLGVLFGSVPMVGSAASAIVEFLRPIPSVAMIPLALVALGGPAETKVWLAVFGAVWPILFNTVHAVGDIDPVQINTAKAFNLSRRQMLTSVKLPSIAPFVLTGIRVSASIALILVVSTEVLAGGSSESATLLERGGLGGFITDAGTGGARMDLAIAGTFVAGLVGFVINLVFVAVQRRWVNWSDGDRAR
jgi:NitT/TauT family transport system permease protein